MKRFTGIVLVALMLMTGAESSAGKVTEPVEECADFVGVEVCAAAAADEVNMSAGHDHEVTGQTRVCLESKFEPTEYGTGGVEYLAGCAQHADVFDSSACTIAGGLGGVGDIVFGPYAMVFTVACLHHHDAVTGDTKVTCLGVVAAHSFLPFAGACLMVSHTDDTLGTVAVNCDWRLSCAIRPSPTLERCGELSPSTSFCARVGMWAVLLDASHADDTIGHIDVHSRQWSYVGSHQAPGPTKGSPAPSRHAGGWAPATTIFARRVSRTNRFEPARQLGAATTPMASSATPLWTRG